MKNVLVVIAMEGEAEPFIKHLALSPVFIEAKFPTACLFHSVILLLPLPLTFSPLSYCSNFSSHDRESIGIRRLQWQRMGNALVLMWIMWALFPPL